MRRVTSLKTLLTFNILLTLAIGWVVIADGIHTARPAQASEGESFLPDAGAQRNDMIRELRRINSSITDLRRDLATREFNVAVKSMPATPPVENK